MITQFYEYTKNQWIVLLKKKKPRGTSGKPTLPTTALNVKGLNIATKRQKLSDSVKKPKTNNRISSIRYNLNIKIQTIEG